MEIKVLGSGCDRCKKLEEMVSRVVYRMGIPASVEKVTDIQEIMRYGCMMTPGLVVNGKVVCSGRIPGEKEISKWLEEK